MYDLNEIEACGASSQQQPHVWKVGKCGEQGPCRVDRICEIRPTIFFFGTPVSDWSACVSAKLAGSYKTPTAAPPGTLRAAALRFFAVAGVAGPNRQLQQAQRVCAQGSERCEWVQRRVSAAIAAARAHGTRSRARAH